MHMYKYTEMHFITTTEINSNLRCPPPPPPIYSNRKHHNTE